MILAWIALGGALITTALGQGFYKLFFHSGVKLHLGVAILFFAMAPLCNYVALRQLSIDTVYMSTAVTQLLVLGFAARVLKEKLTRNHCLAAALIVTGIVIYTT